jgi:hypothetical protein
MRIDPECRDPELLAAEVRRLQAVIAAGEPTLTAEERAAIEVAISGMYRPDVHHLTPQAPTHVDTLRKLLERLR